MAKKYTTVIFLSLTSSITLQIRQYLIILRLCSTKEQMMLLLSGVKSILLGLQCVVRTGRAPSIHADHLAPASDASSSLSTRVPVNSSHGRLVTQSNRHTVSSSHGELVTIIWAVTSWPCDELTGSRLRCANLNRLTVPRGLLSTYGCRAFDYAVAGPPDLHGTARWT